MIPAIAQTLAEILAGCASLEGTEQIDFSHPGIRQDWRPGLNLYCYNLRESDSTQTFNSSAAPPNGHFSKSTLQCEQSLWFDVSFLVSAWDFTSLGEQRLLSEALVLLLRHRLLREELLTPTLRGHGDLSMTVSAIQPIDAISLWNALGVPLRPALCVTVAVPFGVQVNPSSAQEALLLTPASQVQRVAGCSDW